MYKIGLSSCGFALTKENFQELSKANIDCIEISLSAKDADPDKAYFRRIKALSAQYNVHLWSYHLPFFPFSEIDPSSSNKTIRHNTLTRFTKLIQQASAIGIDKFIVHASAEPIPDKERLERIQWARQTLDTLAETAHKYGATIAVEDLPRSCLGNTSEEIAQLVSINDKLRVCFDTNHLLSENACDFIRKLADKIITTHISDYDFINERHWLPGEGKLDWPSIYAALQEIRYSGVWMYEISLECPKTILRDRSLTFTDFYDNATCLFSQQKPKVFSTPKENLGMWE